MIERQQVDLDFLESFLDSIGSYSEYLVQTAPSGERTLYHYTTLEALTSIVGDDDLWLTNSRFSNDRDEIRHGYDVAQRVTERNLNSYRQRKPRDDDRIEFLEALAELIREPAPEGFFICCFCEEGNLLSQWRSYGANGLGVSVGFHRMGFMVMSGADMPHGVMRLWRVFYDGEQQERIVEAALSYHAEELGQQSPEDLARRAADAIQFFIPTFKNDDFQEEREHRLIFTPSPSCPIKPGFRVSRGMLVPYYSVRELMGVDGPSRTGSHETVPAPPPILPLDEVMVGPGARQELNRESVERLLRQRGHQDALVVMSDTPYRG